MPGLFSSLKESQIVSEISSLFTSAPSTAIVAQEKNEELPETNKAILSAESSGDEEDNDNMEVDVPVIEEDDEEDKKANDKKDELTRRQKKQLIIEQNKKTLFLGNVPVQVSENKTMLNELKVLLKEYGEIESIRFRSIAFDAKLPRKVAFIQKKFHAGRDSCNAYVVYKSVESVKTAVEDLNGKVFHEKHLRADFVEKEARDEAVASSSDPKKCVFLGNLPFDVQDEVLWSTFGVCGDISYVRVVRDRKTNVGKGIGYVQFKDKASVDLALKLTGSEIAKREVRVTRCKSLPNDESAKKSKEDKSANTKSDKKFIKTKNGRSLPPSVAKTLKKKVQEGTRASRSDKPILKKPKGGRVNKKASSTRNPSNKKKTQKNKK